MNGTGVTGRHWFAVGLFAFAVGLGLRTYPFGAGDFRAYGDERFYAIYLNSMEELGPLGVATLVADYAEVQAGWEGPLLPPTRVAFLWVCWLARKCLGSDAVEAVRAVSAWSSVLYLGVAWVFGVRAAGARLGAAALWMLACAPLQIHAGQRAWIDGYFALAGLVALWGLWESLRAPGSRWWPLLYGLALCWMVMTKENAAFVWGGLAVLLAVSGWLGIGRVPSRVWVWSVLGPALGVLALMGLSGGAEAFFFALMLNVEASYHPAAYAVATGDGPWFRYLLDLLVVQPVPTLLAVGALVGAGARSVWERYHGVFWVATYALMASVENAMNLRYGLIWDLPMRLLAAGLVFRWGGAAGWSPRFGAALPWVAVAAAAVSDLSQYLRLFVADEVYDPVPGLLLRALEVLK